MQNGSNLAAVPLPAASRSRAGSSASASAASLVDKEQLAQALDRIHTSAYQSGTLTTFNDFAPPPASAPAVETKGTAGDLVQNGFSGLYSRFKEAVGVGSKGPSHEVEQTIATDGGSKTSRTSLPRVDSSGGASLTPSVTASSNTHGASTAVTAPDGHSLVPPSSKASLTAITQQRSANSSAQSLPKVTTTVPTTAEPTIVPVTVTAFKDNDHSRPTKRMASQLPEVMDAASQSAHSTLQEVDSRNSSAAGKSLRDEDNVSMDGSTDQPLSPGRGRGAKAAGLLASVELQRSSSGSRGSATDTMRKPAVINRISPAMNQISGHSRSSSLEPGTAEPSPINTSAHNSVYHESFAHNERPEQLVSGALRIPGTTTNEGAPEMVNARLESMRKQVLSKEFWMADETCKDCFLCGAPFSAFRRKHHCRTCGCIFDSKCTSIISGQKFGVPGSLRVCKTCLDIINRRYDSASDDSGDDTYLPGIFRPPQAQGDRATAKPKGDDERLGINTALDDNGVNRSTTTPMMAIPTRRIGDPNRQSAVLEIDAPQLSRPSSSKSLKGLLSGRPQSSGHKRHHSKHNFMGRFKASGEGKAPFRSAVNDELARKSKLPAFHDDNIIDPDLAPFMSDESSGDEQMSIVTTMASSDLTPSSLDPDKSNFGPLMSAGRKGRFRQGDKSVSGLSTTSRGLDDTSLAPPGSGYSRPTRRRNLSTASASAHHIRTPRPKSGLFKGPSGSTDALSVLDSLAAVEGSRSPRSYDSVKDEKPLEEVNPAILNHIGKLFRQLLQDANVAGASAWEKAIIPVLLRCASHVSPNVRDGDAMDVRHYVKFKKIPGGKPSDTSYVSGIIFSKNLALKSMPRKIFNNPRIVVISFPIEYQRQAQQHFMSLQPVIEQEKEFLRIVVSRITALRPQFLLAEKSISGVALQYLSEANIAVAYNVKPSVIEAVSRIAKAEIISSLDMLALPVQVGQSGAVEVKTFVNDELPGKKKTYIFISGCDRELGCTIALRGASTEVLRRMKKITEFMIYVVYSLKLESSLMLHEQVDLQAAQLARSSQHTTSREPSDESLLAGPHRPDADHPAIMVTSQSSADSHGESAASTTAAEAKPAEPPAMSSVPEQTRKLISLHESHSRASQDSQVPEDVPMPTFYSDMVAKYETKILSASPFVKFTQPYLLMRAREQERRLVYLKRLRDQDVIEDQGEGENGKPQRFQLIKPEMVHELGRKGPRQIMEVLHAVHDAEYDKALYNYQTQTRQWENYIQGSLDLFDPYSHQNIVVLYSLICTDTKIPCAEPGLIAIGFYDEHPDASGNMDPDCSLGQYIEDLCDSAEDSCPSSICERPLYQHHRTYVHGEARITVFIEKDSPLPPGTVRMPDDEIYMWSYCKVCKKDLGVCQMSENAWKYSFGKYLELSFWSHGLRLKDKTGCVHDHMKDHIRYFSFHRNVVRIHYDPIDLLEIVVPRVRITWKVDHDLKLKNEVFSRIEERWSRFIASVKTRLKSFKIDSVLPEKAEACKAEVERLAKKAQDEQPILLTHLQQAYMNSKYYEVIPLNVIIREMLEKVTEWDAVFTKFEADFLSDKDVRQLTILQLRKMFTDNESKESLTTTDGSNSIGSEGEGKTTSPTATLASSIELAAKVGEDGAETVSEKPSAASAADSTAGLPAALPREPSAEEKEEALARVGPLDLASPPSPTAVKNNVATSSTQVSAQTPLTASTIRVDTATNVPPSTTTTQDQSSGPTHAKDAEQLQRDHGGAPSDAAKHAKEADTDNEHHHRTAMVRGASKGSGLVASPPMIRALSQPAGTLPRSQSSLLKQAQAKDAKQGETPGEDHDRKSSTDGSIKSGKKFSDRIGLGALKKKPGTSNIPRYTHGKRSQNVSSLARHFEQLSREFSREFEKERMKERKQRAAKMPHARAFLPRTSTRAIVEVYEDVDQAVQEPGPLDDDHPLDREHSGVTSTKTDTTTMSRTTTATTERGSQKSPVKRSPEESMSPVTEPPSQTDVTASEAETDHPKTESRAESEDEGGASDADQSMLDDLLPEVKSIAESLDQSEDSSLELHKHQKSSLMNMLTNFWAERSAGGWTPLEYPLNATDHIFIDSDVIVREDEPSSLIAFALSSDDYQAKLADIRRQWKSAASRESPAAEGATEVEINVHPQQRPPEQDQQQEKQHSHASDSAEAVADQDSLEKNLMRSTSTHLKYQFTEGSAKMLCKIFYAEQFDALRRKCGVADRIIESLSRCAKWDSKGGKTKSVFLKTLDDRLVMKSLSPIETSAFLRFAPSYFSIMAEALFHDLPSVIAKMLGFFQIIIKNPLTGSEVKLDLLLMENLFYDRAPTRIFDLKGSMRNRRIQSTGQRDEVLLDENMVEYIYESPLFAREHSKKLLRASVWNDTLFLARQNVMDYSLMVAVDEARCELVVGIIDCIRTYTWDKRLESWIKDRGFAGGGRNKPTVTSPKEYKSRFREAMARQATKSR